MRFYRKLVAILVLWMPLTAACAADIDFPAPDTAVNAHGMTTYLDLARHFVPDIKATDNGYVGTSMIAVRHIGGKSFDRNEAPEYGFFDIATTRMKADGKERLAVLFDFAQATRGAAQGTAILALYDMSGEPKLIDAADIGFDQSTYFFDQGLMPVADGTDVILTMSTHFNSSQTYITQSMIMVRDDRLQLIDNAMLLGERTCAMERQQSIRYAANPNAGKPYAPIAVTVTDIVSPSNRDCGDEVRPAALKSEYKVIYHWDVAASRYVVDSNMLEKLAKANEQRY